ncbi:MAG: AAA family ATPase [Clostridia bacterium]|nr:AAA family ATPase [Clostridia bacterium]
MTYWYYEDEDEDDEDDDFFEDDEDVEDEDDDDVYDDYEEDDDSEWLRSAAVPVDPSEINVMFDDIYGYDNIKTALQRIVDMANSPEKYTRLGVRMPYGVMLYGDPGVGKTMMAKAMMHDMNRPVYVLRKVQADNAFLKLIGAVFEAAAENAPSVILLDDLDKFPAAYGSMNEFSAVQAGIDSVKDKEVLVVATVNNMDVLPNALCRHGRFDRKIEVPLPSIEDAAVIISRYLVGKKVARDVNMKAVAKLLDGYTCAALDSILNDAGMFAGFEGKDEICMADIVRAVLADIYDIDSTSALPLEGKARTAYHEAGHVAAAMLLNPGSVAIASVRGKPREKHGFMETIDSDGESYEDTCLSIITALAGRAATEIKYSSPDMGSSDDVYRASRMCDTLVEDVCIKGLSYITREYESDSDNSRNARNVQQTGMLEDFYNNSKKLLRSNWALVEMLACALTEKETLICDDLDAIYADYVSGKGVKENMIPAGSGKAAQAPYGPVNS